MSTPPEAQVESPAGDEADFEGEPAPTSTRRFVLALRILAALSTLMALAALWSVEARQLAHDLQLAAPPSAHPGDRIALRALIFRDVDAPEGATLALASTHVRLLDEQERELARVALEATPLTTLDGGLWLPSGLAGRFTLEARAVFEGAKLVCRRSIRVDARAEPSAVRGREAGALQQQSLGHVRARGDGPLPDRLLPRLLPRVIGGACVPGTPCRVLVWMGEPAASLHLVGGPSAMLRAPPIPATETSGLVELEVLIEGLDAQVTLEARRAGIAIAERALRLPVGLGEVALLGRESIIERDRVRLSYAAPPGREHLTFDVFVAETWAGVTMLPSSGSLRHDGVPASRAPTSPATAPSQPGPAFVVPASWTKEGLLRVQARADRLSAEGAGARVVYVRAPGEDTAGALRAIARSVAEDPAVVRSDTDAWASGLPSFAAEQPQQTAGFLLASLEQLRMPVPLPVSGRPAQLRRLAHTRGLFRFGVAGALVLSAFLIALTLARRGLSAADEAAAILEQARVEARPWAHEPSQDVLEVGGKGPASVRRARFGARVRVLLLALAVAAAFLAAALLIAAKPLWF